ncbi:MAG: 5-formyltetrahydrofolate cyclo-ligase [Myxococcota bacterium]
MEIDSKDGLRRLARRRRREVDPALRARGAVEIAAKLAASAVWLAARRIALYRSLPFEVDTQPVWDAATKAAKQVFFPRCTESRSLDFVPVTSATECSPGPFGIREPMGASTPVSEIDLVVMPLLAFDRVGARLGYGAGFYDRALALYPGIKLGVSLSAQESTHLPQTETDVRLDWIVTEREVIQTQP